MEDMEEIEIKIRKKIIEMKEKEDETIKDM
jgi:hypothetical protein